MTVGFQKSILKTKTKSARTTFKKFAFGETGEAGVLSARESVNCLCLNGELRAGVGLSPYLTASGAEVLIPSNIADLMPFVLLRTRSEAGGYSSKIGGVSEAGTIFVYDETAGEWKLRGVCGGRVQAVEAVESSKIPKLLLFSKSGGFTYGEDNGQGSLSGLSGVRAVACVYRGRVFCVEGDDTLAYSSPYAPTDFTESVDDGGRISLPTDKGKIVALVPFREDLLVFYEYGIFRFLGAGTARDFRISPIGYGGGKIFGDSVGVCPIGGEKAFFLAEDGLYRFDGSKVLPVCKELNVRPKYGEQVCVHGEFDGFYFLGFTDENGEKRGVVVDAASESGGYAFMPVGLSVCGGKAVCRRDFKMQYVTLDGELPEGEISSFVAKETDFGITGRKTLKNLRFEGKGDVTVTVTGGNRTETESVSLDDGVAKFRLDMRGESFSLSFVLSRGALLRSVTAELVWLGGNVGEA